MSEKRLTHEHQRDATVLAPEAIDWFISSVWAIIDKIVLFL